MYIRVSLFSERHYWEQMKGFVLFLSFEATGSSWYFVYNQGGLGAYVLVNIMPNDEYLLLLSMHMD